MPKRVCIRLSVPTSGADGDAPGARGSRQRILAMVPISLPRFETLHMPLARDIDDDNAHDD